MHLLTIDLKRTTRTDRPAIRPEGEVGYLVEVDGVGAFDTSLDWDQRELLEVLGARHPEDGELAAWLGGVLRTLLTRAVVAELDRLVERATAEAPLHVTVRTSAIELLALPWALLQTRSGRPLGQLEHALVRMATGETPTAPPRADPLHPDRLDPRHAEGQVLFAWAAPFAQVPHDPHQALLEAACAGRGLVVVPEASVDTLRQALEQAARGPRPVSVLHLLAHGQQSGGRMALQLHGPRAGVVDPVDADRLRDLLAPYADTVRLVVLAACGGAAARPDSLLGGLAQGLHRAGVAAVVASSLPLTFPQAAALTEQLYGTLLQDLKPVEAAFLQAREATAPASERDDRYGLVLFQRPQDEGLRPLTFRPYRGLQPFDERHAALFTGRTDEAAALRGRVDAALARGDGRLVVVAGASGSGKSSLVQATLLPALKAEGWAAVLTRPDTPGGAAQALFDALQAARWRRNPPPEGAAPNRPERVTADNLSAQLLKWDRETGGAPLLIVVDQLEELFTAPAAAATPADREAFARGLFDIANAGASKAVVVCTVRLDFMAHLGELRVDDRGGRLDQLLFDPQHVQFLAQIDLAALRELILAPARKVGVTIEERLVREILTDVGTDPAALPLLQHLLDELWHRRDPGGAITFDHYQALGKFKGALATSAQRTLEALDPDAQAEARRLMVRMVYQGDEQGGRAKRRVAIDDVRRDAPPFDAAFDRAVDAFVAQRLLTRAEDGAQVELGHVALLRAWPTLQRWADQDRELHTRLMPIQERLRAWEADPGPGRLLGGDDLNKALALVADYGPELSPELRDYVTTSRKAEQTRARRKRMLAWGFAALMTVVAVALAWLAVQLDAARETAVRERDAKEEARRQAVAARNDAEQARAVAEAAEADALAQKQRAEAERDGKIEALGQAEQARDRERVARSAAEREARRARDEARMTAVRLLKARDPAAAVRVLQSLERPDAVDGWPAEALDLLSRPLADAATAPRDEDLRAAAADPLGTLTLQIGAGGEVWLRRGDGPFEALPSLWEAAQGAELLAVSGADGLRVAMRQETRLLVLEARGGGWVERAERRDVGPSTAAVFSPGGDQLIVGRADGSLVLIGLSDDTLAEMSATATSRVTALAMGRSGGPVSVHADGRVLRHTPGGSVPIATLPAGSWSAAAVSPDARWLVVAPASGAPLALYRPEKSTTFQPLVTLEGHDAAVLALSFSPDGATLRTAAEDGATRRWPWPPTGAAVGHLGEAPTWARLAGDRLLVGTRGGARLGRFGGGPLAPVEGRGQGDVSADGRRVVLGGLGAPVRVLERAGEGWTEVTLPLPSAGGQDFSELRMSADGRRVAALGGLGSTAWAWTLPDGPLPQDLPAPVRLPGDTNRRVGRDLALSADGRVVALAADDRVLVWTTVDGQRWVPETIDAPASKVALDATGGTLLYLAPGGGLSLRRNGATTRLGAHPGGVTLLAVSGDRAVSVGADAARVWDLSNGESLPVPVSGTWLAAGFTDAGALLAVGADGRLWAWRGGFEAEGLGRALRGVGVEGL
ncbi:MAG: CHAT domain-containing protein [Alphaproteobacteria bacterium]|nr:CHAT domain-containing protein [Alphaproteobacteria bacterium]